MKFQPMAALAADNKCVGALVSSPRYIASQKVDGRRALVTIEGGVPVFRGRNGSAFAPPAVVTAAFRGRFPSGMGTIVLDGELLRSTERHAHLFLFDLPYAEGLVDFKTPYHLRLAALGTLVERVWGDDETAAVTLLPFAETEIEKVRLVRRLVSSEAEGVVFRTRDGVYAPGKRNNDLLKCKFRRSADVIVLRRGERGRDNLILGCHPVKSPVLIGSEHDDDFIEVGAVSALTGDGPHVKLDDVVTVEYLHFSPAGKMVQPVRPLLRHDKTAEECRMDQFRPVNLKEIPV